MSTRGKAMSDKLPSQMKDRKKSILILRPLGQEQIWKENIEAKQAICLHLPVLKINHLFSEKDLLSAVKQHAPYSAMIVVSANAIAAYDKNFAKWVEQQSAMKNLAIGEATAQVLQQKGIKVDWVPKKASSEVLLEEYPWEQLEANSSILILGGKGGRDLLQASLTHLKFKVHKLETYQRCPATFSKEEIEAVLNPSPDAVIASSIEILLAFIAIMKKARQSIKSIPVVAISERIAEEAKKQGFISIITSDSTSFESIWFACEKAFQISRNI